MDKIKDWASASDLKLNSAKCCEIIISLPTSDRTNLPHTGLTWVEDITALGVTFTNSLSFEPHVLKVANKATTCLYALKTLKAHGLQSQALRDFTLATAATLLAQRIHASPAWSGFIKSEEKAKLHLVLNKTARYWFLRERIPKTIDELLESSDITLFKAAL